MKKFYSTGTDIVPQSSTYLVRSRLHQLLENAMDYPIVIVCAGAGYGKTRALYSFLQDYDAYSTWLQISTRDNNSTRFWESYANMLTQIQPEIGASLKEIGFPETDEALAKYTSTMHKMASLPGKHIRVFDDFHLLQNPVVIDFFARMMRVLPPNEILILISRTTPDINIVGMMMYEKVFTISEDELCFTEGEIADYFNQLELKFPKMDIRNIFDDTQGWAFAVNLIGRSLGKEQKYERYALEAMKRNIFRLIEKELSGTISDRLWRFLLRISLIEHLAASLIRLLANDETLIKEMEQLNAYIRYDFQMDSYLIHHLFLEYLQQKQDQFLSEKEIKETFQTAGEWCEKNGYFMDALSYYENSGDYNAIAVIIGAFNVQMPMDMAKYALEIFDKAPDAVKLNNAIFPGMHIRLKMNMGRFDEDALALSAKYAENFESQPETPERSRALAVLYANWAFLLMFRSTYSDVYNFDFYFKKMGENYSKNPFKTVGAFNIVPISAWASLVGTSRPEAHEEYISALTRAIPSLSALGKGFFVGFDDLARGELYYYQGEFDLAEQCLNQSIKKARASDQYITFNRALVYLMQIAFFRGDFVAATRALQMMEELLNDKDFGVRYTMYDIACGFYCLELGQPEQTPEWLKSAFSPYVHPSYIENYANQVRTMYYYQTRQDEPLMAFIDETAGQELILFGKIELNILESLLHYKRKRRGEAIAALTEAYDLAESNKIIVPFTRFAREMRTLTAAAMKDSSCRIEKKWLEDVNRKSSAFGKRKNKIMLEYRQASQNGREISLTNREMSVLKDLIQGFSRGEIAENQNISINMVKMIVNSIYEKLGVSTLKDAIRIATQKKLI